MIIIPGHYSRRRRIRYARLFGRLDEATAPLTSRLREDKATRDLSHTVPSLGGLATKEPQDEFDEYGAELGKDARVWKTYVKEADAIDKELVGGWNESLDVILIFAALFSAICTAFVIESSKRLEEDPAETSAQNLAFISQTLQTIASGGQLSNSSASVVSGNGFKPARSDVLVNALWFLSLALSVTVSLIAMLAKEWCYIFLSNRTGQQYLQVTRRQKRWDGLEHWKMPEALMFLPSLLHLALFLFAIGLCIRLWHVHLGVAIPVLVITTGAFIIYGASSILPLIFEECPYGGAFSKFIKILQNALNPQKANHADDISQDDKVSSRALQWMIETCEDPQSVDIALQAIAGAAPGFPKPELETCEANKMIRKRLIAGSLYSKNYERVFELYARALAFFQPPSSDKTKQEENNQAKELQRKIRALQTSTETKVANSLTRIGEVFIPSANNLMALRIGSTTASHCLQTLSPGTQIQEQVVRLISSAVDLLEKHSRGETTLHPAAQLSLSTGTAMLLSCAVAHCDSPSAAQIALRLIPKQGRMKNEYLGLLLAAFAFSRAAHPDGTHSSPLGSAARAEQALNVIEHYGEQVESHGGNDARTMITLGLLELLSQSDHYKLDDEVIKRIGSELTPLWIPPSHNIHALPPRFDIRQHAIDVLIPSTTYNIPTNEVTADVYISILNRMPFDIPNGKIYTFVAAYIYQQPTSGPLSDAVQELILRLPLPLQSFCNDAGEPCESMIKRTDFMMESMKNHSCGRITDSRVHLKLGLVTALLILHSFTHGEPPAIARLILRLLPLQGVCNKCLGLISLAFALFENNVNYPCSSAYEQFNREAGRGRIIAVIEHYASHGGIPDDTAESMLTLGLSELLRNMTIYKLNDGDLNTIGSTLIRLSVEKIGPSVSAVDSRIVHTFPPTFGTHRYIVESFIASKCGPARISNPETHSSLATSVAMFLPHILTHSDVPTAARLILQLLSAQDICDQCIGLSMMAFAFSRGNYTGPEDADAPLACAANRIKRAIQAARYYIPTLTTLTEDATKIMKALGLLELLSNQDSYDLTSGDFEMIQHTFPFPLDLKNHQIHTLKPTFDISQHAMNIVAHNLGLSANNVNHLRGSFINSNRSSAITYLVVLHHAHVTITAPPPESIYMLILECLGEVQPDTLAIDLSLNLMDRLPISQLSQALVRATNRRGMLSVLTSMHGSRNLSQRLFAKGQMCLFVISVVQSLGSTTDDARKELDMFFFGSRSWDDPPGKEKLIAYAGILVSEYKETFDQHTPYLHSYFDKLLGEIDAALACVI
ncbi:Ribonuclease [Ceratobasidium theobromae]|uniref:Ribonuclease n=1 Tax=Ceratobasidium theobromae TaxID=1582974 RepID=A0A5N5QHE8_9AGAM|nr:Ribonuclease [Ceratobasidium theobromae]